MANLVRQTLVLQPVLFLLINTPLMAQSAFLEGSLDHGMKHISVASDFMGAAVAVFDYNNDGWQDVYLTGGLHSDKLFKNLGGGVFTDVTNAAGGFHASTGYKTTSVVTADLNNDGFREVIVGTARNMPLFVYQNNGDGTFTHITPSTGMTTTKNTQAIVAGDYNLDGRVDIYVINYVLVPRVVLDGNGDIIGYNHTCSPNDFYQNNGNFVFQEIGASLGADDAGCGLAGLFTDIDGDYMPDLFVANDFGVFTNLPNRFYHNNFPAGGLQDQSVSSQLNAAIFGMGIAQGDYDKDGLLDLYVTNLGRNILHRQTSAGVFQNVTTSAGVGDATDSKGLNVVGWGTAFLDYDNDGYEDLYVSNGYVPSSKTYETGLNNENKLFHNLKNGTFEDVSVAANVNDNKMHRGMAVGDFDNDGDEDMIVTKLVSTGVPLETNVLYYINQQGKNHHWLQVSLKGTSATTTRDAYGSTVKVHYANTRSIKTLAGGSSHASQNSSVLHFGLFTNTLIDSVEVFWPGGSRTRIKTPPTDTHLFIEENSSTFLIRGCTNPAATNFNPQATQNYGCYFPVAGCTNVTASNYNPTANVNDGSCTLVTGLAHAEALPEVVLYPNPLSSHLTVEVSTDEPKTLELFDVQGRSVYNVAIQGRRETVYPLIITGLYYYRLTSHGKILKTGKLFKQ
ncbi:MAG: FG-GAP-like repeat-containing protein [Cytophagales bacterium]|nr:FG-GAP-like repeat-containing protein [Cytophagales bacterium]